MAPKVAGASKKDGAPKREITAADKACEMIVANDFAGLEKHLEEQLQTEQKSINKLDQKLGKTALFTACEEGRIEMVRMIMDYKAKVNFRTRDERTAIMGAAHYAENEIITCLIEDFEADIHIKDKQGDSAVHIAARRGHLSTLELLIAKGAAHDEPSLSLETPLANALKMAHFKVCDYLLSLGANINVRTEGSNTPLTRCAFDGRIETCRYILNNGGDPRLRQDNGETPVMVAIRAGHYKLASLLMETTANAAGTTGTTGAAVGVAGGIDDRDSCGRTALMFACMTANAATVQYCLENCTNINMGDDWGYTPLVFAVRHAKGAAIVDTLLAAGADPNIQDKTFRTALHYCLMRGQMAVMAKLLEAGADPSLCDDDNKTPLDLLSPNTEDNVNTVTSAITVMAHLVKPCRFPNKEKPQWLVTVNLKEAEERRLAEVERQRIAAEAAALAAEVQRLEAEAAALANGTAIETTANAITDGEGGSSPEGKSKKKKKAKK